jgi:hypothetical protein
MDPVTGRSNAVISSVTGAKGPCRNVLVASMIGDPFGRGLQRNLGRAGSVRNECIRCSFRRGCIPRSVSEALGGQAGHRGLPASDAACGDPRSADYASLARPRALSHPWNA